MCIVAHTGNPFHSSQESLWNIKQLYYFLSHRYKVALPQADGLSLTLGEALHHTTKIATTPKCTDPILHGDKDSASPPHCPFHLLSVASALHRPQPVTRTLLLFQAPGLRVTSCSWRCSTCERTRSSKN